jgi:hypothetical protein
MVVPQIPILINSDIRMLCMDFNVMFINIVNVYICILYCPCFIFLAVQLVVLYFCKKIRFLANLRRLGLGHRRIACVIYKG